MLFSTACTLTGKDVSPVVGGVMPSTLPTTVECAFRAELSLQAWRRLRHQPFSRSMSEYTRDKTAGYYLNEEEVVCFCEEIVRDGCYFATEDNAG